MPSAPSVLTVRTAVPGDAAALAVLAERTFRDTFAAANTAENMDRHCRETYGEALQAAELADPGGITLLAQAAGALAGFAQLRHGAGSAGEIRRLYVDKAWHGRGVAQALMDAAMAELRSRGAGKVWLGVWERNPRAIAFYRKYGFRESGEKTFVLGGDPQRDIVMEKTL